MTEFLLHKIHNVECTKHIDIHHTTIAWHEDVGIELKNIKYSYRGISLLHESVGVYIQKIQELYT